MSLGYLDHMRVVRDHRIPGMVTYPSDEVLLALMRHTGYDILKADNPAARSVESASGPASTRPSAQSCSPR